MSESDRPDEAGPSGSRRAVLLALVLVAAVNAIAAAALDSHYLGRDARARNPNYRRLWPDYVLAAEPRREGESLVVVISNSQGYGPELPQRFIYPERLEQLLAERWQRPVRVVNWSVQSGNATDFILLASAAGRLDPDVTLLVSSPRNFGQRLRRQLGEPVGLDFGLADIPQLVAWADIRARLPETYADHYVGVNPLLDASLARFVPLWRYRDLPQLLAFEFPALRPFTRGGDDQNWRHRNPEAPWWQRQQLKDLPVPLISWELVDEMGEVLALLPGRRIHALMPSHSMTNRDFQSFYRRARGRFERAGVESWDLSDLVEDRHFITVSHMKETGHEVVAEIVAEKLAP